MCTAFDKFLHRDKLNRAHYAHLATHSKFKVLFLVLKFQLGSAPKYLCDHIQAPISASSLCCHSSSLRQDIFMPRVRTTMGTLGPLLLLVHHSGITFLLLFVRLFCLLPFPHLSLALSLTFFLELKCTESA